MFTDPTVIKEGPLKLYSSDSVPSKCSKPPGWRDVYCRLRLSGWMHWYSQAKSTKPICGADLKVVSAYIAYGELLRNVMSKPGVVMDYDMARMFVVPIEPSEISGMNFFLCASDADMSSWIASIFNVLDKPVPEQYQIALPAAAYDKPRSMIYDMQPNMGIPGEPVARNLSRSTNPSPRPTVPATPPPVTSSAHPIHPPRGSTTPARRSTASQSPCMLAFPQSTLVCRVIQPPSGTGPPNALMQPVAYSVYPLQSQPQNYAGPMEDYWGMDGAASGANEVRQSKSKAPKEGPDQHKSTTRHTHEARNKPVDEPTYKEETPTDTAN